MRLRLPAELHERAERLVSGEWQPPEAVPASTVVLMRDNPLSVYLMRRVATMSFAAGMHVFPGGRISDDDFSADVPWAPSSPWDADAEARRVSADPQLARALVVCAVRETFEETGVLIARTVDGSIVGYDGTPDDRWESDRAGVLDGDMSFADVLSRRGLSIDPHLLPVTGHWVTPEVETRRYDVRFYAAAIPPRQAAVDVGGEADKVHWTTAAAALREYAEGRLAMLPPTVATIAELAAASSAVEAMSAARTRAIVPLLPRPVRDGDGIRWVVVDARDGRVVHEGDGSPPAGSEVEGVGSPEAP